jgi:hypothetical protein
MSLRTIFGCTAACCLLLLCCAVPAHAQTLEWVRQLGTSEFEYGSDVSAVYIASVEFDADGIPSLSGTPIVLLDDIDTFLSTIFV